MDYTVSSQASLLNVALTGTFRFDDHDGFKGVLTAIDKHDGQEVHIDLSGTTALDSAGVGMLLLAHERAKKQKKKLSVGGAAGAVAKVLDVTRVGSLIDLRP